MLHIVLVRTFRLVSNRSLNPSSFKQLHVVCREPTAKLLCVCRHPGPAFHVMKKRRSTSNKNNKKALRVNFRSSLALLLSVSGKSKDSNEIDVENSFDNLLFAMEGSSSMIATGTKCWECENNATLICSERSNSCLKPMCREHTHQGGPFDALCADHCSVVYWTLCAIL